MPTGSGFPLLLLVLLTWNEGTRVLCQNVNVAHVTTDHVELTWEKSDDWLGVSEYSVLFSTPESAVCNATISCQTTECTFSSIDACGVVDSCSKTTTVVSGGDHTAPEVVRVTGPEGVTNIALNIDQGVLHITWNNPSTESSPCYEKTAVRVFFLGEPTTTYHGIDEEYQDVELCANATQSTIEVWTIGGDGESYVNSKDFIYSGSDVVYLVKMEPCKPLGCTSLQASWDYLPVCSAVVSFNVTVGDDNSYAVDIDSTNTTITGLQPNLYYTLCVMAMSAQGSYIDKSCQTCYSFSAVINNLQAVTIFESSSALEVTWDPRPCSGIDLRYKVRYTSFHYTDFEYTSQNSIVLDDLYDYHYNVCVHVDGGPADPICTPGFSTIQGPSGVFTLGFNESFLNGESPLVMGWDFDDSRYPGVNIIYQLTWGSGQQYNARTQNKIYTIQNYTNPDYKHCFCVAAIPDGKDDLMSAERCTYQYGEVDDKSSSEVIIWVSVTVGIIVLVLIIGLGHYLYKRRH